MYNIVALRYNDIVDVSPHPGIGQQSLDDPCIPTTFHFFMFVQSDRLKPIAILVAVVVVVAVNIEVNFASIHIYAGVGCRLLSHSHPEGVNTLFVAL